MFNYLIFIFSILIFIGCSSDNTSRDTNSIDNLYASNTQKLNECETSKQNASITSPTDTPMLVVLVNYSNIKITSPISTWAKKIFSKTDGSLNDYYEEISNSQFEFSEATECNGIASVTLDMNHPNTDINSVSFAQNIHPSLSLALTLLDDKISFNAYDTNGDGHIQAQELLITFIIAGYEDSYEGKHIANGIWAHQFCMDSLYAPLLDGVSIMGCANKGNYALFGEKHNSSNPHDATIGIIAHELGHSAFNLPDLYLGGGIGNFGLMGGGTWGKADSSQYSGQTPVHMSAWSKYKNNWVTLDDAKGTKTMNATSSNSYNVVKVQDGENYYLLENRANSGYDRGLYLLGNDGTFDGGLAIWQIDDTYTTDALIAKNKVNDDAYQGVYMLNAKGGFVNDTDDKYGGKETALFYEGNVNSFLNGDANITNISTRGANITLDVN